MHLSPLNMNEIEMGHDVNAPILSMDFATRYGTGTDNEALRLLLRSKYNESPYISLHDRLITHGSKNAMSSLYSKPYPSFSGLHNAIRMSTDMNKPLVCLHVEHIAYIVYGIQKYKDPTLAIFIKGAQSMEDTIFNILPNIKNIYITTDTLNPFTAKVNHSVSGKEYTYYSILQPSINAFRVRSYTFGTDRTYVFYFTEMDSYTTIINKKKFYDFISNNNAQTTIRFSLAESCDLFI